MAPETTAGPGTSFVVDGDDDLLIPNLVATALLAAHADFKPLKKSGANKHFHSTYSTLADILEACVPALAKHGVLMVQLVAHREGHPWLRTVLIHAPSGEVLESEMPLTESADPQVVGSDMTYKRRYLAAAMLGLEGEWDDDGEVVAEKTTRAPASKAAGSAAREPDRAPGSPASSSLLDPENPACPNCSGAMWDHREPSRGGKGRFPKDRPKAPDWKCRDKDCLKTHEGSKRPSVYWTNEWQSLCAKAVAPEDPGDDEPPADYGDRPEGMPF